MASGIRQAEGDSLSGVGFETDESGQVSVTTDGQGKLPDVSDAAEALSSALFGQGDSVTPAQQAPAIEVDAEDMPQRLTFQEAVDKGVVGPIGTFTTTYTTGQGTENRNHNIELVSQILDNSICKSGETWSYNGTTGIATRRRGFWERAPSSMASTPIQWAAASARLPLRCSMRFMSPVFRSSGSGWPSRSLHGHQQRHQIADHATGLAADKLGKIGVLLLRHDGRTCGERIGQLDEAELGCRPNTSSSHRRDRCMQETAQA